MRHKTFFILNSTFLVFLFVSCSHKPVFDEERLFDRDVWNRFTPEQFEINVDNIENYYNIDFTVSIDTGRYRYDAVPLMVILTSPGGEERQFYSTVALSENGRPRGEMQPSRDGNRACRVVTGRIRSYFSFNHKGTHRVAVSQATSQYDLEGIHAVRLTVTQAKLEELH